MSGKGKVLAVMSEWRYWGVELVGPLRKLEAAGSASERRSHLPGSPARSLRHHARGRGLGEGLRSVGRARGNKEPVGAFPGTALLQRARFSSRAGELLRAAPRRAGGRRRAIRRGPAGRRLSAVPATGIARRDSMIIQVRAHRSAHSAQR